MKPKNKPILKALLCFLLTFLCHAIYAQLSPFTLTVTPTPQTCLGNGNLAFTTGGTTPGSNIDYAVYLLPNITTPLTTVTTSSVNGLVAGSYQVVATQTLGNLSNTATATAEVINYAIPLAFTLVASPCTNGGMVTVNVTSGTPVSYEIIAGPQTRPLQSSNIFTNLPLGLYSVRVHDNCGDAVVVDVNLQPLLVEFFMGYTGVLEALPACDKISLGNYIDNNEDMAWPVTLTLTVHPPGGGADVVLTKTMNSYSPNNIEYIDIPFYYNQNYTYSLKITDACGNTKTINTTLSPKKFDFVLDVISTSCDNFTLTADMSIYKTPCTVTFVSAPAGFNPSAFNASHPVFTDDNIVYGSASNPVPFGNYMVMITDSCGHSATHSITVSDQGEPAVDSGLNFLSNCTGYFKVTMPFGRDITSAVITAAPDNYEGTLPQDVMEFVIDGTLNVQNIPAGNYTVLVTDSCGDVYTVTIVIVESIPVLNFQVSVLPGCEEGVGSIAIIGRKFADITIVDAPDEFEYPLPFNASSYLWDNDWEDGFSMGSLPPGSYTMNATDECGNVMTGNFYVIPYEVFLDDIEIIPGCGSFNAKINYSSNSNPNFVETFWLQKYDDGIGMWTHPLTGNPYMEGDPIYQSNAEEINNYMDNYFTYSGKFRIMRNFGSYSDPGPNGEYVRYCNAQIYEFTYYDNPHIDGAYGFTCGDGTSDVIIDAQGLAPLLYEITAKDGQPFTLDNGTSNFFQGLDNGTYNFRVTDNCNNFLNIQYDITILQPFAVQSSEMCEGKPGTLGVQGFSFLEYEWSKDSNPNTVLSTDATLDFTSFESADTGAYTVHVTTTIPGSCIDETLHIVVEGQPLPKAGEDNGLVLCRESAQLDMNQYLQEPFDTGGVWSDVDDTGQLWGNVLNISSLPEGTYHFKYTVTNTCGNTDESDITLTFMPQPGAPSVAIGGPVCEGSSLQLTADTVEGASYSWTGPNGFTSQDQNPVLQNVTEADGGVYKLRITLEGTDCSSMPVSVTAVVNKVPDFTLEGNSILCGDEQTTLNINAINFDNNILEHTYTWYHDNEQMANNTWFLVTSETGTYKVIVDANGCSSEKEIKVTENDLGLMLQSGCVDNAYVIDVTAGTDLSGATFIWSGPEYAFTGEKADITNLKTGEYTVAVTTADGCSDTASLMIDTTYCGDLSKGVSPNGDGLNDFFDLSNLDVDDLKIFNRYGLKVYEAQNYRKEWYGQSDKGTLPTGTYYYVLMLSSGKQRTGWVYLQREE